MPGGSVPMTPCGLSFRDKWGPNRHAGKANTRPTLILVKAVLPTKQLGRFGIPLEKVDR